MAECPPAHLAYDSQMLADNAVTLHQLLFVNCPGYHAFPCGDHFHVGHKKANKGERCKVDPVHRSTQDRIRNASKRVRVRP